MIEAFYTGGGIWIAQTYLDEHNMTYAVVSSEASSRQFKIIFIFLYSKVNQLKFLMFYINI